jgi:hypothetical protein
MTTDLDENRNGELVRDSPEPGRAASEMRLGDARGDRTRLGSLGAASLWVFLSFMYGAYLGVLALPGLVPAVALMVRGQSRRVLQGSVALGIIATALGLWAVMNTTSDNPIELAGFVVVPVAATIYAFVALAYSDQH